MSRCNHDNVQIVQYEKSQILTTRIGSMIRRDTEPGSLLKKTDVHCLDCGSRKHYVFGSTPQWIKDLIQEADNGYDSSEY